MFKFTRNTRVDREFRVREILKLINANKEVRKDSTIIDKVILKYVLSENTLNIKANGECKEIYIIEIQLKERKVPLEFIKFFDKFIQLHTYFILIYGKEYKEFCIYRYLDGNEIKRGKVYESSWSENDLSELSYCFTIEEIYKNLFINLLKLDCREDENLKDYIYRFDEIERLKKEIDKLKNKAFKETQPRKKFEITKEMKKNREILRTLKGDNNGQAYNEN